MFWLLVVDCGNSGMEIALDLSNFGAKTAIVVRNLLHILNKKIVNTGLILLKYLPRYIVDAVLVTLSKQTFGDMSKFGINRPKEGPLYMKWKYGKYNC
ncbi:hypothetical protein GIB67_034483 [Kingdonia uniflora]|uniref:Uncharacterized protein n=1 Tax=Kingdonia uniflora TaxID=39325 RepID=A0A7J7PB00_9MAGN|nr:hypothetical protein GIB67_034483 [Kingdonia uniflora]